MNKKHVLLAALVALPMLAVAQILDVQSVQKVATPANMDARVAGISQDGSYILLTTSTNTGLKKYDLATGQITVISEAAGAGYNAQISADGNDVVYREITTGKDRLRRSSLLRKSLDTQKSSVLVSPTRDLEGYAIHGNMVLAIDRQKVRAHALHGEKTQVDAPVVSIENFQLMLTRNGKTEVLSPNGTAESYLWPSISPDGTKVLYYVSGIGAYVANIDGSKPQFIARECRAAQWYNNNVIVGMADKDNGEVLLSSAIVAYTLDGKKQVLTDSSLLTMYPYASADGSKIVCSTDGGEVYLINIRLH